MRLLFAVLLAAALALPATASAAPPTFNTLKLSGANGSTEPRMAVGRDDARWVVTNGAGGEVVYVSRDQGQTWTKSEGLPPQKKASIDVDFVTMPTGRILSSELDYGGVEFPPRRTGGQGEAR